jgi:hypothetical protein
MGEGRRTPALTFVSFTGGVATSHRYDPFG